MGELERGGVGTGTWAGSSQGDQALYSFRPRGARAWVQPVACPCMRRWVGQQDWARSGRDRPGVAQAEAYQAGPKVGLEKPLL